MDEREDSVGRKKSLDLSVLIWLVTFAQALLNKAINKTLSYYLICVKFPKFSQIQEIIYIEK